MMGYGKHESREWALGENEIAGLEESYVPHAIAGHV